MRVIFDQ